MTNKREFPIYIATLKKSGGEILLSLEKYRGIPILNIRFWFKDDNDKWRPGRQGIALHVNRIDEILLSYGRSECRTG
jgi:hypothetical protein